MELAQRYVYSVYQNGSFSKAAQKLFISQPSLSAMVKKHEKDLQFLIFDRSKAPLELTPEGQIYIEYLEESIEQEKIMRKRLQAVAATAQRMELNVGGSSFLACQVFSKVCAELIRRMPGVNIRVDGGSSITMGMIKDKVEQGTIDIALAYTYDPRRFDAIPIFEERFYLSLRKDLPNADKLMPYSLSIDEVIAGDLTEPEIENKAICEAISEIPMLRRKTIPALDLQEYIDSFAVSNCAVWNSRTGALWYEYMLEGLGADITSDIIIAVNKRRSEDVIFLPINATNAKRTSYIIYKKGAVLSREAEEFVAVLKEMCSDRKRFFERLSE